MIKIYLIWDFDGPIGQINATYPYNFHYKTVLREIQNVQYILDILEKRNIHSIFAITGFTGEEGSFPYNAPDLIRQIHSRGHEIASHSWKHEWLPKYSPGQVFKSMKRSKDILEQCIGISGSVAGFVPPHNRPMTWMQKYAYSLGDIMPYPLSKTGNLQNIIRAAHQIGYKWIRVSYQPFYHRIKPDPLFRFKQNNQQYKNLKILLSHSLGFAENSIQAVKKGVMLKKDVVITAHPSGLSRKGSEHTDNFMNFLDNLETLRKEKKVEFFRFCNSTNYLESLREDRSLVNVK